MDLLGRKRIAQLLGTIEQQDEELAKANQTIREMAATIREMDQRIFRMSQCTDWSSMRPIFNELQTDTEARMRKESDRIKDVMRRELLEVYTK